MATKELTLERVLTIWWSFVWRAGLASGLGGAVGGFIAGYYASVAGSPDSAKLAGLIVGWLLSFPCSIWAFREALRISYQDFEITLGAKIPAMLAAPAAATPNVLAQPHPDEISIKAASKATRTGDTEVVRGLLVLGFCGGLVLVGLIVAANIPNPPNVIASPTAAAGSPVTSPLPPSKGANMVICSPLPPLSAVIPTDADQYP